MAREVDLPSGAKLKVNLAPFAEARALWNAVLAEMKDLKITDAEADVMDFIKGLFCAGFASERVAAALSKCMQRCTINGQKVQDDMFESEERRGDYVLVCLEVAEANIGPFLKEPLVTVRSTFATPGKVEPRTEVIDDDLIYYFRLCKAGFARSVKEAQEFNAREVLQALQYEKFLGDYERAYLELNK